MEPESYDIEVLYFINPYLIWVEAKNSESENVESCFEQIGVYGVLPLEVTVDPIEDTITSKRSADWMPAATVLMKKLFDEAVEVSFCPIHCDYRTTVFDNNIHKYGEVIIKKPNGKYRLLSKLLVKSGVAIYNKNAFDAELSSGNIKTKLSSHKIKDIIKHLTKKCKKQAEKQTKVFQESQSLESALTVQNLAAHNQRNKKKTDEFEEVLQRKQNDLQLCKDTEEESAGRATKKKVKEQDSNILELKQRLQSHGIGEKNAPAAANYFIKQRMEDLNALQKPGTSKTHHTNSDNEIEKSDIETHHSDYNNKSIHFDRGDVQKQSSDALHKVEESHIDMHTDIKARQKHDIQDKEISNYAVKEVEMNEKLFETYEEVRSKKEKKRSSNKASKVPDYDIYKEARIAYGPPGTNLTVLPCKIVDRYEFRKTYMTQEIQEKEDHIPIKIDPHHIEIRDHFGEQDSDVEIEVKSRQVPEKPVKSSADKIHDTNSDDTLVRKSVFNNPILKASLKTEIEPSIDLQPLKYKPEKPDHNSSKQESPSTSKANSDIASKKSGLSHIVSVKTRNYSKDVTQTPTQNSEESQQIQTANKETSHSLLKKKLRTHKENLTRKLNSSTTSDTSNKDSSTSVEDDRFKNHDKKDDNKNNSSQDLDSDEDSISEVLKKINSEYKPFVFPKKEEEVVTQTQAVSKSKNHVNPFKNADANVSKFVDKLVTPVLMVHSKMNKRFQPTYKLRDVPFNTHIQIILKNMGIDHPMMLQTITWSSILRGYSTFMISPKTSGKTMGYLPAVCRLVADKDSGIDGVGPISLIVCATSNSVSEVEKFAKLFLGSKQTVLAIYSGMNELQIATSLLNGCDMLICTPAILVRLLQTDFGVDLRRLTSFVLDDCERLAEEFGNEIKIFLYKIKEMLKSRVQKEVKVQYILASRIWCDFMEPLAKKAPDTVVCIGAFQECVLYSKANTTASFVTKENKIKSVLDFLKGIDTTKRTVIVCRTNEEVAELEKALIREKYVVFASNSEMTVQDLYNLRGSWDDYHEAVVGPILLCLDGNLTHLNVTDAHYLIHFSLPSLFSAFCKRFSVINENYPSIFKAQDEAVKIKILLEDSNVEQLPKIMHFIKRCTTEVPTVLDEICEQILVEKDMAKAKKLVPICDNLLTLGECPDFWNCLERHAIVKEFDEPQDWVPKKGLVSFKILHYHTAVFYSARLLENTIDGQTTKYPQNYNMLSMKISMYFGRESNRRLHGVPEVGDICAVSMKQNFFVRCQVVKILSFYQNGKPDSVLVRLIDEEKFEKTKDVYLYHLPDELKHTQTHVVHVRLANLQPKDKDITFSQLAKDQLQKTTDGEEDLFMRGQIALTVGKSVFLESAVVCRDLSTLGKTVVLHDFKKILLENHALLNDEHLQKLNKLCLEGGIEVNNETASKVIDVSRRPPIKKLPKPQWAHLEKDDLSAVFFASAEDPSTFFVRLVKFADSCSVLVKDIQKYAAENTEKLLSISEGDIVLAKLPDDDMFERARIDEVIDDDKVKCFFVDQGDWREVSKQNLISISEKLVTQLPFQAIECRLFGVRPPGENWTEFVTNWFTNCFQDKSGNQKQIYAKYFTKEKAQYTNGHKYGVVLIDTNSDQDVIINQLIMDVNLAREQESEVGFLDEKEFKIVEIPKDNSDAEDVDDSWERVSRTSKSSVTNEDFVQPKVSLNELFPKQPIRSVPLVGSDESETSEDRWQINMTDDFMAMFKPVSKENTSNNITSKLPAIKSADSKSGSEVGANQTYKNQSVQDSDSDSSIQKLSSVSDIHVVPSANIKELDSDDYTSPESSMIKTTEKQNLIQEIVTTRKQKHTATPIKANVPAPEKKSDEPEPLRKPKVLWHQKMRDVTVKILLVGVEKYDLIIDDRQLKFHAIVNDTEYGFDITLYGIIDKKSATHSNKGQYIRINLHKVMGKQKWLSLTKTSGIKNWIVYDVDALDVSDEEIDGKDDDVAKDMIKGLCNEENNTDSEEEDFIDDVNFGYSR